MNTIPYLIIFSFGLIILFLIWLRIEIKLEIVEYKWLKLYLFH